jgi:hypothetical protein
MSHDVPFTISWRKGGERERGGGDEHQLLVGLAAVCGVLARAAAARSSAWRVARSSRSRPAPEPRASNPEPPPPGPACACRLRQGICAPRATGHACASHLCFFGHGLSYPLPPTPTPPPPPSHIHSYLVGVDSGIQIYPFDSLYLANPLISYTQSHGAVMKFS